MIKYSNVSLELGAPPGIDKVTPDWEAAQAVGADHRGGSVYARFSPQD